MLTTLTLLALMAPQGVPNAPVVINEFSYDQTGSSGDVMEFAELYNRSGAPIDISNWVLDLTSTGGTQSFPIPAGTVLPTKGFWVMGDGGLTTVNQVLGSGDVFDDSNAAITLRDPTGLIIDTVAYETNKGPVGTNLTEGEGIWGNYYTSAAVFTSIARYSDGYDTNDNGRDFRLAPATVGTSNDLPNLTPYLDTFDSYSVGAQVPNWSASFVVPEVIDPMLAGTNPNSIPASPTGGNAMIVWDPLGGGNAGMMLTAPIADVVLEGYVYLDATAQPTGEYQTWSIGIRGMSLTFHNHCDPAGDLGALLGTTFTANGNTGLALEYIDSSAFARLYLVDENDGGNDQVVLGSIDIMPGVNDGWQRIRLQAVGSHVDAFIGGTYGCGDGVRLSGTTTTTGPGGVYVGYREALVNNTTARPPTLDFLSVVPPQGLAVSKTGSAVATTQGTPTIDANSLPVIGNSTWAIQVSGLIQGTPSALTLGTSLMSTPLSLQGLGGQSGSFLYVMPLLTFPLHPDAMGNAKLTAPISCFPTYIGTSLYWQAFDADPALGIALPLGNTAALTTTLGQ